MTVKAKSPRKKAPAKAKAKAKADLHVYGVAPYKRKKNEEYMSDGQLEHFRTILENWKRELMEEVDRTIHHLRDEAANFPDSNDRAAQETEFGLELKTRDRERKLIRKIDAALERITQGSYGYCEKTGEEIGLSRLEARPIATMSVEAQERYERAERHFGD
ncbi:MAG: RNA polymerase-binding protein DksA [Pseudomonadota bacterium]